MSYISKTNVIIENSHCYTIYQKFSCYELYIHNSFTDRETLIGTYESMTAVELEIDRRIGKVRDKFKGFKG